MTRANAEHQAPPGGPPSDVAALTPEALSAGDLELIGRIGEASNIVFLARAGGVPVIYKPVQGERPLWDFPHGTLAQRETAAHVISAAGGWDLVPPTVLRTGPFGTGSVQAWVGPLPDEMGVISEPPTSQSLVGLVRLEALEDESSPQHDWHVVTLGELSDGTPVAVAHADDPRLRSLAVLDAVLNNSDRKGSHILLERLGARQSRVWAIDNGLCLADEPKLRTVLWGWEGDPVPQVELRRCHAVLEALEQRNSELVAVLDELITVDEVNALLGRLEVLVDSATHPLPSEDWPALPWPPV